MAVPSMGVSLSGCSGPEWVRCPLVGAVVMSGCGLVGVSFSVWPVLLLSCAVVPPVPSGVRVVAVTSTTLTLWWDTPPEPSLVKMYLIELWRGQGQWSEAGTTPGDTYGYTLKQLLPETLYIVRVVASNEVGNRTSEVVAVSTAHQGDSGGIEDVWREERRERERVEGEEERGERGRGWKEGKREEREGEGGRRGRERREREREEGGEERGEGEGGA